MIHKIQSTILRLHFIVVFILTQRICNPTTASCDITDGTVTQCDCTSTINLSSRGITSFESDNIFSECGASITTIYLHKNELTSLPKTIFNDLTSVTSLDLDNNYLISLPDTIFDDLTSLTSLLLYNNPGDSTPCPIGTQYGTIALDVNFCIEIPETPTPSPSATLTSTSTLTFSMSPTTTSTSSSSATATTTLSSTGSATSSQTLTSTPTSSLSSTTSATISASSTGTLSATPSISISVAPSTTNYESTKYPVSGMRSMNTRVDSRKSSIHSNTTHIIIN